MQEHVCKRIQVKQIARVSLVKWHIANVKDEARWDRQRLEHQNSFSSGIQLGDFYL